MLVLHLVLVLLITMHVCGVFLSHFENDELVSEVVIPLQAMHKVNNSVVMARIPIITSLYPN